MTPDEKIFAIILYPLSNTGPGCISISMTRAAVMLTITHIPEHFPVPGT